MERLTHREPDGTVVPVVNCRVSKLSEIYDRLAAIEDILGDEYDLEHLSPCTLCRFNPPSSCDGKPCCMCPAKKK